ncbi:hypothetical protein HYH38_16170 [Clostridium botulinum]|uniref:hypothetical protein n=1 Tax=Clostridium botulinum TaxID=1491 RepID=UPI000366ECBE|nr:hypothetical protein [Clostridium botulinum]MBY6811000.1 hypothetical protein [Clostridium botulinum]MBY6818477.1 hypothetical protein [Clostridium botulinum]MBY6824468.1 hypothetical protein [Clostridium botulinum]MBY6828771.1 hypothetical protein [Clostridium botulinum]MBY6832700.1 hypothetical protein [Clostridium botulinum]
MIIGILIVSVVFILYILINRSLNNNSKSCEFNLQINISGIRVRFKTKEKNAPSNRKR